MLKSDFAKSLVHLDMHPVVVGIGTAVVTFVLTPIIAPPILGIIGFGSIGPVAGEFSQKYPLSDSTGYVETELFFIY